MDTEWHAFCDCPLHSASRSRFVMASNFEFSTSLPSTVGDLVPLITSVRTNARNAGLFAKFALDIRSTRRHLFRQLSSDGPSGRSKVAARVAWERWRAGVAQFCGRGPLSYFRCLASSGRNSPRCGISSYFWLKPFRWVRSPSKQKPVKARE